MNVLLHGLPTFSGIAIGTYRLVMLALHQTSISQVTAFFIGSLLEDSLYYQ